MTLRSAGVYFRRDTKEVIMVSGAGRLPPGPDWVLVSDDTELGLLDVRDILRAGALADEAREVYWYGMWHDNGPDQPSSRFACDVKRASEDGGQGVEAPHRNLWSRLRRVLWPFGGRRPDIHSVT